MPRKYESKVRIKYDENGMTAMDRANRAKGGAPSHLVRVRPGSKHNVLDGEADVWKAVKMLASGKTYQDIADELNKKNKYQLTRWDVWSRVNQVLIEWKRENLGNMENYITEQLALLEEHERQAMEDYENSRIISPQGYAALMKRGMTIEEIDELYSKKPLPGDPRFLDIVLRFQKQRMALLGLGGGNDVPQQTVITYSFGDISLDELSSIADKLQDAKLKELTIDNQ